MSAQRLVLIGAVAAVVFTLDRLTKMWVERSVPLYEARPVLGDYVRIVQRNAGVYRALYRLGE